MTGPERLADAVRLIAEAPESDLTNPGWLARVVAGAGLFIDPRPLYGPWATYCPPLGWGGALQHPEELAEFLIFLSGRVVRSAVEIGFFCGWTTTLLGAYLRRFEPDCVVRGFDLNPAAPGVPGLAPNVHFVTEPAFRAAARDTPLDLAFIDADHSYAGVSADFADFGHARLVAFHDINDQYVRDFADYEGGVWRFWRELKAAHPGRCTEFLRDDGVEAFGIGVYEKEP